MATVGSARTHLIVIRGDTGSGKSTLARAIRDDRNRPTALLDQDFFRWELLHGGSKEQRSRDTITLIDQVVRTVLDQEYDVILEGIRNLRDYSRVLEALYHDHQGQSVFLQFDIGPQATIERHRGRAEKRGLFTEEDIAAWYEGWQPLAFVDEQRLTINDTPEAVCRCLRNQLH